MEKSTIFGRLLAKDQNFSNLDNNKNKADFNPK